MIRGDVSAGAAQGMMMVTPGIPRGTTSSVASPPNGVSTATVGAFTGAPRWVKLTRSGNLVTASESPDGDTWTVVGSDTDLAAGHRTRGARGVEPLDNDAGERHVRQRHRRATVAVAARDLSPIVRSPGEQRDDQCGRDPDTSAPEHEQVTVDYATAAGTATAGTDYTTTKRDGDLRARERRHTDDQRPDRRRHHRRARRDLVVNLSRRSTRPSPTPRPSSPSPMTTQRSRRSRLRTGPSLRAMPAPPTQSLTLTLSASSASPVTVAYATAAGPRRPAPTTRPPAGPRPSPPYDVDDDRRPDPRRHHRRAEQDRARQPDGAVERDDCRRAGDRHDHQRRRGAAAGDHNCRPVHRRRQCRHQQRGADVDPLGQQREPGDGRLRHRRRDRDGRPGLHAPGTATFAAKTTSTTIGIPILGDTTVEPNETCWSTSTYR